MPAGNGPRQTIYIKRLKYLPRTLLYAHIGFLAVKKLRFAGAFQVIFDDGQILSDCQLWCCSFYFP